jgi:hypothetical protein
MKRHMDLLGKALRLESKIAGQLDKAAKGFVRSGAREPLEIVHAILDRVEHEIQSSGRGKRVFPFNRIEASILAPSPEARARLEAVVSGEPSLNARVLERLQSGGCSTAGIVLVTSYVSRAQKTWRDPEFDLNFARVTVPDIIAPASDRQADRIEVTVLRGVAGRRTYSFPPRRIDFGRCAEVRDSRNRLIRTNHVAFTEGAGDVNQSVSRQHAHVSYEPGSGDFRLHDDGGGHGTGIVRDGRTVPVPRGSRGVRLHSEDEIVLGEARVRIRFVS